jgi:hypothetical protein
VRRGEERGVSVGYPLRGEFCSLCITAYYLLISKKPRITVKISNCFAVVDSTKGD